MLPLLRLPLVASASLEVQHVSVWTVDFHVDSHERHVSPSHLAVSRFLVVLHCEVNYQNYQNGTLSLSAQNVSVEHGHRHGKAKTKQTEDEEKDDEKTQKEKESV